jgi:hypothetical protein
MKNTKKQELLLQLCSQAGAWEQEKDLRRFLNLYFPFLADKSVFNRHIIKKSGKRKKSHKKSLTVSALIVEKISLSFLRSRIHDILSKVFYEPYSKISQLVTSHLYRAS